MWIDAPEGALETCGARRAGSGPDGRSLNIAFRVDERQRSHFLTVSFYAFSLLSEREVRVGFEQ